MSLLLTASILRRSFLLLVEFLLVEFLLVEYPASSAYFCPALRFSASPSSLANQSVAG